LSIKTVGKVTKHKVPPKGFFSISVKHCFSLKHIDYKSSVFFRKHTSQYTHVNDSFPRHPGKKRGKAWLSCVYGNGTRSKHLTNHNTLVQPTNQSTLRLLEERAS